MDFEKCQNAHLKKSKKLFGSSKPPFFPGIYIFIKQYKETIKIYIFIQPYKENERPKLILLAHLNNVQKKYLK